MIELTRDQINPTVLVAKSFHPDCGAIVLFLGTVREFTLTKKTKSLRDLMENADNVIEHLFNVHVHCNTDWCVMQKGLRSKRKL